MKELRLPPALERERRQQQQQQQRPPPVPQAARVEVVRPTAALAGDARLSDSAAVKPTSAAGGSISVSSEGRGNTLVASVGSAAAAGKAAPASSQGGNGVPLRDAAKRAQTPAN